MSALVSAKKVKLTSASLGKTDVNERSESPKFKKEESIPFSNLTRGTPGMAN